MRTDLYTSGGHVELSCKARAHDAVGLLVAGKGLFKDFELGRGGSLAVLYLVGDVRIEFSEVDEGGIYAWRDDIWDTGVWETRVVAVHGGEGGRAKGRDGERASARGGRKERRRRGEMKYRGGRIRYRDRERRRREKEGQIFQFPRGQLGKIPPVCFGKCPPVTVAQ